MDTAAPMGDNTLTILRARGRRLAKVIRPDGIQGYHSARTYDLHEASFDTLEELHALLQQLLPRWDCAVVRGAILDPSRTVRVRRLLYLDKETGDTPTLADRPRAWIAMDADGIPAPAGLDLRDLLACGVAARATLPEVFLDAACVVQASAGHTIKPGLRLRLWFRLDRALTGAACQRWLRNVPGVDPSTLRAAQVTYTAAPLFEGVSDPLVTRLAVLPGENLVPCPSPTELAPPIRQPADVSELVKGTGGGSYARAALTRACSNIARAPVDSRHPTAVAEAWTLARLVVAGLLSESEVIRAVDGALEQAGKPKGEGAAIAEWAVAKRTDSGNFRNGDYI